MGEEIYFRFQLFFRKKLKLKVLHVYKKWETQFLSQKTLNVVGFKCPAIYFKASGVPLVFLHGLSYTAEIWENLGFTNLLMEKHVPFLALDMPYGIKSACSPKTRNAQKNIQVVNKAIQNVFGFVAPVVVGASMGGNIALHYAANFPVKGLLLIAPARALDGKLLEHYERFKFPVRLIWGSIDSVISGEEMRTLAEKLPNAKLIVYKDAGHSAYKDQPDRFKRDLLELYVTAEQA